MVVALDLGHPLAFIFVVFDFAEALAFFVDNEQGRYVFFSVKLGLRIVGQCKERAVVDRCQPVKRFEMLCLAAVEIDRFGRASGLDDNFSARRGHGRLVGSDSDTVAECEHHPESFAVDIFAFGIQRLYGVEIETCHFFERQGGFVDLFAAAVFKITFLLAVDKPRTVPVLRNLSLIIGICHRVFNAVDQIGFIEIFDFGKPVPLLGQPRCLLDNNKFHDFAYLRIIGKTAYRSPGIRGVEMTLAGLCVVLSESDGLQST